MKYSIIVTTYNSAKYIKRCLDSIVAQDINNFKVLVIDDGSNDNTKEIINNYQKKYKNIEYYYKTNGGVSNARNFGINKVETPYFLFLDSDDLIEKNLIKEIDKYSDYDILSFQSIKVDEQNNVIKYLPKKTFDLIDGEKYLKALMNKKTYFFLSPWGYVFNTKFWKKNNFNFSPNYVMEDSGLIPLVLLKARKIISLDYFGYRYVQTNNSIIRTNDNNKIEFKTISILHQYDNLIEKISKIKLDKDFMKTFDNYFAGWLLWYGTTLNKQHLAKYMNEIKKRNIFKKLKKNNIKVILQIIICKINYNLYFKLYNFINK